MATKIILLQLMRRAAPNKFEWRYLVDNQQITCFAAGEIADQLLEVLDEIQIIHSAPNTKLVVVTQSMPFLIENDIREMFPEILFLKLSESNLREAFKDAFAVPSYQRKVNKGTLFIGADASGGHEGTISAWAWVTSGVHATYSSGVCEFNNMNISEFEGILRGLIANKHTDHSRIHIYSDSQVALEMWERTIVGTTDFSFLANSSIAPLITEAREVVRNRKVTVEWVRGHRSHRLNQAADCLSRHTRRAVQSGQSMKAVKNEADAMFSMFRR